MKLLLFKPTVLFMLLLTLSSCSAGSEDEPTTKPTTDAKYTYSAIENETLNLINDYRKSVGLNSLEKNDYVSIKAEEHTNYMISKNVLSHDNASTRFQSIIDNLRALKVAENNAFNYNTGQEVIDAWLKSPGHKANIDGDYTHFGISIRSNSDGKRYFTNIFVKIK
jgi:uncharacterized protein YkwD